MAQIPLQHLIRMRREVLGWSRQKLGAEVAKREGLGKPLTHSTIQQWENGTTAPKRKRMTIVADLLGIEAHEIVPTSAETSTAPRSTQSFQSLEECIRRVALALMKADPEQRDVACALLSGLARNPENNHFVATLSALLETKRDMTYARWRVTSNRSINTDVLSASFAGLLSAGHLQR